MNQTLQDQFPVSSNTISIEKRKLITFIPNTQAANQFSIQELFGSDFSDTIFIILHAIPKTQVLRTCTHPHTSTSTSMIHQFTTHAWTHIINTYIETKKPKMGTFWICSVVIFVVGSSEREPFNICGDCCIFLFSLHTDMYK